MKLIFENWRRFIQEWRNVEVGTIDGSATPSKQPKPRSKRRPVPFPKDLPKPSNVGKHPLPGSLDPESTKLKVLIIGDSVMVGISRELRLSKKRYSVYRRAIGGASVTNTWTKEKKEKKVLIKSIKRQWKESKRLNPDVLIINGGVNDLASSCKESIWERNYRAFNDIISEAISLPSIKKVIVFKIIPRDPAKYLKRKYPCPKEGPRTIGWNKDISSDFNDDPRVVFLGRDNYKWPQPVPKDKGKGSDGVHPYNEYPSLAQDILNELAELESELRQSRPTDEDE